MSKAGNVAWNRRGASRIVNSGEFANHSFDCDSSSSDDIFDADVASPHPCPPAHVKGRVLPQVLLSGSPGELLICSPRSIELCARIGENQSCSKSASISLVFLTKPMRGKILVTVDMCSSIDMADMASSAKT